MRVVILAPQVFPFVSGNAVTVERWRRELSVMGVQVKTLAAPAYAPDELRLSLESFKPDVVHVHHAYSTGTCLLRLGERMLRGMVIVVSPGGTDINIDYRFAERREAMSKVFHMAAGIVVQSGEISERIQQYFPQAVGKITRVPKAILWFGDEPCNLREHMGYDDQCCVFFLPAGIRPVKRNLECLVAMARVHELRPSVRFLDAGPAIDAEYALRFSREVTRRSSFAAWIEGIRPEAMRSAYESCDVVLNASLSEGMPNSLLEALAVGKPILASDISGNRCLVQEAGAEPAGILYDVSDAGDFVSKALKLIDDLSTRRKLGAAARLRAARLPMPDDEASALLEAYQLALSYRPNL